MKNTYGFHRIVFSIGQFLAIPYLRLKFRYSFDKIPELKGPYLLLANHNTDFDPLFVGAACPHQVYFVATEKILRMGMLTVLVMALFQPIIHYKGKTGISSVKEILSKLKEGKNVALFPEGNRSFNGLTGSFLPSTGKLARRSGASLVTYRLHGGYFTSPRWSATLRKGKMRGELVKVYTPDELKTMTEAEINQAIRQDLQVDAYQEQQRRPVAYDGADLARGLESTLFLCPSCGKISTLRSEGDALRCTSCGFHAVYDAYGYLHGDAGEVWTITELDARQQEAIRALSQKSNDELLFSDNVEVETIGESHEVLSQESALLAACSDRLIINQNPIPFLEISGMAINQRNLLILHTKDGQHLELNGDISFSALKYLYLYRFSNLQKSSR